MERQDKDTTWPQMLGDALDVADCSRLGLEMPEGVDRIESGVEGLIEMKAGHVLLGEHGPTSQRFESLFAVVQRRLIQIHSGDGISPSSHFPDKPSGTASGFEDSLDWKWDILAKDILEEPRLGGCFLQEAGFVPLGMIVPVDRFAGGFCFWFFAGAGFQNNQLRDASNFMWIVTWEVFMRSKASC